MARLPMMSIAASSLLLASCTTRQETKTTTSSSSRPLPDTDTNASELLRALKHRKTSREFADRPLPRQVLADLLWAANGINRADGGRTAPSAHNVQSIEVYVADASGLYRYDAQHRALDVIKAIDLRALTGLPSDAATAPVNLIFVNDDRRFSPEITAEQRVLFAAAGAGAIMENTYLFCAANDLNVGVRADMDRAALAQAMGLLPEQRIILAQSVGYPPTLASLKTSLKRLLGRD